jgi:hypothetical protein
VIFKFSSSLVFLKILGENAEGEREREKNFFEKKESYRSSIPVTRPALLSFRFVSVGLSLVLYLFCMWVKWKRKI